MYSMTLSCSASSQWLASFPGPVQLSVASSTVLEAMESWTGPGSEVTHWLCYCSDSPAILLTSSVSQYLNTLYMPLTSSCCVYSNVYGLGNIHCIRYHTVVNSIGSTSRPAQVYHPMTSFSVEIPLFIIAKNSSSIGEEPIPYNWLPSAISGRKSTTSRVVSHTAQGMTIFTNVLQGHKTVVLVHCTIEWEPDTYRKEEIPLSWNWELD